MSTTSPPLWKSALAEVIGTLTLVFVGAGAILSDVLTNGKVGVVGIALAHGVAIATMVSASGHLSGGHFNPGVKRPEEVTLSREDGEALIERLERMP